MNGEESRTPRRCTYILPIRRASTSDVDSHVLADYFRALSAIGCDVLVVDGSTEEVFAAHALAWSGTCHHVPVNSAYKYLNGKVNGILTGIALATCEYIVVADDDIRYTAGDIFRACSLLDRYEVVRPQHYVLPLPWWARVECVRMLITRGALRAGDYPGTCAFRRSTWHRVGHYDGDVLFDNEELVRHFALMGARVRCATDFFVLRLAPSFAKWLEQRPRHAYEDFNMFGKTALFALLIPLTFAAWLYAGTIAAFILGGLVTSASVLLAVRGLLRDRAYRFFSAATVLYSPIWVLTRALSVYMAAWLRCRYGGCPFGDSVISKPTGRAWAVGGRQLSLAAAAQRHSHWTEDFNGSPRE